VSAHDAPGALLARPHSSVAIGALDHRAVDLNNETRTKGNDRNIGTDAANSQLGWFVFADSHDTGSVRRQILRLRTQLSVGTREEKVLSNEPVEHANVGRELCASQGVLERYDFWIVGPDEDFLKSGGICGRHVLRLALGLAS